MNARRRLGEELRRLRRKSGLTQPQVAARLKYTTSQFVSNWERGISFPPDDAIKTLAKAYKVSAATLVMALYEAKIGELIEERGRLLVELGAKPRRKGV